MSCEEKFQLLYKITRCSHLEVLNTDGGDLLDRAVALGHQAGAVLLQPEQSEPLLQAPLHTQTITNCTVNMFPFCKNSHLLDLGNLKNLNVLFLTGI